MSTRTRGVSVPLKGARASADWVISTTLALAPIPVCSSPTSAQSTEDTRIAGVAAFGPRDDPAESGHVALVQAMRDAQNDRLIALVATHPDDEYVLPAAFLRIFYGYRIHVILVTRGEGGQNSTGPEITAELGSLRTIETEACARLLGFDVHYLDRPDAGYSRSARETLDLWGRDSTVRDFARALRVLRPDVVLTTHRPDESHGHDLAMLELLPDVIAAAADPRLELDGLDPVAIERVFRGAMASEREFLRLEVDKVDADRGRSYRQIAYDALTRTHRSQAPFRSLEEEFTEQQRFVSVGQTAILSLYEGLPDLFAELVATGAADAAHCLELQSRFERGLGDAAHDRPRLVRTAFELLRRLDSLPVTTGSSLARRVLRRKQALERIVVHAIGLVVDLRFDRPYAVAGETFTFSASVRSLEFATLRDLRCVTPEGLTILPRPAAPSPNEPWLVSASLPVQEHDASDPMTAVFGQERFALPLSIRLAFDVSLDGARVGAIEYPFDLPVRVVPAVQIEVPRRLLIPDGTSESRFNVLVRRNTTRQVSGDLVVTVPAGVVVTPSRIPVDMSAETARDFQFLLRTPQRLPEGFYPIRVGLGRWGARIPLRRVAVTTTPGLRVGLVEGVDDTAGSVLEFLAVDLVRLTDRELQSRDLRVFDTILIDVRALGQRPAALASLSRLLEFAYTGGRLVVLYHKDQEFNSADTGVRAYPEGLLLRVGRARVTREDAPVVHLIPEHPLLNHPNRITPETWDGWVHERGLYFPDADAAPGYDRLLRMSDPDEPAPDTSLLYATTGSGEYVYCALALYRQMRNLHPGACRLFANLISRDVR